MSRLVDYLVVVGFDHEKERSGVSFGKILQRFPAKDWDDTPFIDGIELFCQPQGWCLSNNRQQPTFFVSVLTDIDANRHYCACLSFNEPVAITPSKPPDEEGEDELLLVVPAGGGGGGSGGSATLVVAGGSPLSSQHAPIMQAVQHHSVMYAPKCLVLVSRLDYIQTFRNCLGIIYTVYIDNLGVAIETLIGNILGCALAPSPGGPQVRFSIGAGDRQALQPPLSDTLPVSGSTCHQLIQELGIHNVVTLFCAAMTEHKILFHSRSYSRLTDSCQALVSLMYPFRYSHVYIPLLPSALVEVLSTPTPFIMGVHSSLKGEILDLLDVIIIDLDGGSITIPDYITVPVLPEPLQSQLYTHLCMVLRPELMQADDAFPPQQIKSSQPVMLDKEIRAIFLRMFAQLFQGYRSCLTIIRIHPKPFITFHKAAFLGQRNLMDNDFISKVLDCMFYNAYVADRGPPYRNCDIFDELYANMQDILKAEMRNSELILQHIQELAQQLNLNEHPNPQPYVQKIPKPTEGAFTRIHQPTFPTVDPKKVQEIINEGLVKTRELRDKMQSIEPQQPRIVPMGPPISSLHDNRNIVANSARRLEVLRNCVNCIFENKISDARKTFPAVLRALKSKAARLALTAELSQHVTGNKAVLEHQQFDLVVRLMNCALQDDSCVDEHGVAASTLPLAMAFCRKLCTGVIQFAYTCIQEHPVWSNQQFWEAAFYQDVQRDIRALYCNINNSASYHLTSQQNGGLRALSYSDRESSLSPISPRDNKDLASLWSKGYNSEHGSRRSLYVRTPEPSALEIAAEQMQVWNSLNEEKQKELTCNEESTVYSQAIHYANRMVSLRVPLDINRGAKSSRGRDIERESNSNVSNVTNSLAESEDSSSGESGFEEDTSEKGAQVVKFVSRFVDKVCTDSGVTEDHIKALHQMIPGVVAMQIETLEAVHRESKRLPPIMKPKILAPSLLQGEELVMEGLRVYLIPDGRDEGTGGTMGGPSLLPAEGALFLTNYRVVFKGTPCDPFACEQVVVRSFPVATLTKEKRASVQYLPHVDQYLQEGLQLRSNTFQLIKVAFDEEVASESIEVLRKMIHRYHSPSDIFHLFAFSGHLAVPQTPLGKQKEKNATLRVMAKRTLLKTAMKAGFKPKPSSRKQKYVIQGHSALAANTSRTLPSPGRGGLGLNGPTFDIDINSPAERPISLFDDDVSNMDESDISPGGSHVLGSNHTHHVDSKTLEKLSERLYVKDYHRLGLGQLNGAIVKGKPDGFRVATVNSGYGLCRSYPALIAVPNNVSDDSIRKFSRCYRHCRFPAVTWRHPKTKALLLRASSFHGKSVVGTSSETSAHSEQEKYLSAVVNITPLSAMRCGVSGPAGGAVGINDSTLSITSLLTGSGGGPGIDNFPTMVTPEISRRSNPLQKAVNSLRSSGGKGNRQLRWGSLKERRQGSASSLGSEFGFRMSAGGTAATSGLGGRLSDIPDGFESSVHTLHRVALYVFGEKAQIKGIKTESFPNCDFIPVEFHEVRHVKASFKKLMRAAVPSGPVNEPDKSFFQAIGTSEWLKQLQSVMQLAGAVVDLMDVQGSSVMICLEDGWDVTSQIVSIAELCLDPFYRTFEGFRVLIEKEWLAFGHRFFHRSNHTPASMASGFAPIFLQFLDVVHQIYSQFPLSFEFNEYYLRFLAYHYVSCRFRTFLLDSECERAEFGWLVAKDRRRLHPLASRFDPSCSDDELLPGYPGSGPGGAQSGGGGSSSLGGHNFGPSFWDYVEKLWNRSPIFFNVWYIPNQEDGVLRPYANISNLNIWSYYVSEELAHGPSYDLEVVAMERQREEEQEAAEGSGCIVSSKRKVINACYDSITNIQHEAFSQLLEQTRSHETELGHLPQKWSVLWDKLESPNTDSLARQVSYTTQMIRSHGRSIHKRSTIEILVRGKMVGGIGGTPDVNSGTTPGGGNSLNQSVVGTLNSQTPQVYSHPHRFERSNYTTPTYCDHCNHLLWGLVKTGLRCVDCGYNCHEKCAESVLKNCTKYKSVSDSSGVGASSLGTHSKGGPGHSGENTSVNSSVTTMQTSSQYYDQFSSNVAENRTHEGYLFKRGALLKGWKQRWFVLDSIKHQLRYYDAMEDSHCKGFVDLAEVISVTPSLSVQAGMPKKATNSTTSTATTDEKTFFDLRTIRRTYNFMALDASSAQEWVEKIQACLQ